MKSQTNQTKRQGKLMFVIGTILGIVGVIFIVLLPWACAREGPMRLPMLNTSLMFWGFVLFIVGAAIAFYGRYKYTKAEEKERIEEARKMQQ